MLTTVVLKMGFNPQGQGELSCPWIPANSAIQLFSVIEDRSLLSSRFVVHGHHLCPVYAVFLHSFNECDTSGDTSWESSFDPILSPHLGTSAGTLLFPDDFQIIGRILKAPENTKTEEAGSIGLKSFTSLAFPWENRGLKGWIRGLSIPRWYRRSLTDSSWRGLEDLSAEW